MGSDRWLRYLVGMWRCRHRGICRHCADWYRASLVVVLIGTVWALVMIAAYGLQKAQPRISKWLEDRKRCPHGIRGGLTLGSCKPCLEAEARASDERDRKASELANRSASAETRKNCGKAKRRGLQGRSYRVSRSFDSYLRRGLKMKLPACSTAWLRR
jgi:hypothetical protein